MKVATSWEKRKLMTKESGLGGGTINNLFLELNDDYCGDLKLQILVSISFLLESKAQTKLCIRSINKNHRGRDILFLFV